MGLLSRGDKSGRIRYFSSTSRPRSTSSHQETRHNIFDLNTEYLHSFPTSASISPSRGCLGPKDCVGLSVSLHAHNCRHKITRIISLRRPASLPQNDSASKFSLEHPHLNSNFCLHHLSTIPSTPSPLPATIFALVFHSSSLQAGLPRPEFRQWMTCLSPRCR